MIIELLKRHNAMTISVPNTIIMIVIRNCITHITIYKALSATYPFHKAGVNCVTAPESSQLTPRRDCLHHDRIV